MSNTVMVDARFKKVSVSPFFYQIKVDCVQKQKTGKNNKCGATSEVPTLSSSEV
jgi:hypothetical protein